jgi:hypothetical protein
MMRRSLFASAVLAVCVAQASAAQSLSPHAITGIRLARDVRLSPDASRVAFVVSEPAESERATRRSGIWTAAVDAGSDSPRLLVSGGDDNSPRWSPDGRWLAFLSSRGGSPQIHRIRADGSAPEALTSVPGGVDDLAWSPDGRFIAFTSPEPAAEEDPIVVGRESAIHPVGHPGCRCTHDVASDESGSRRQEFAWSPSGDEIALVAAASPRPEDQIRLALLVMNRRTGQIARRLSENVGLTGALRWSPDGRLITFFERSPKTPFASWLAVIPAAGGAADSVRPILKDGAALHPARRVDAGLPASRLLMIEGTKQAAEDPRRRKRRSGCGRRRHRVAGGVRRLGERRHDRLPRSDAAIADRRLGREAGKLAPQADRPESAGGRLAARHGAIRELEEHERRPARSGVS